MGSGTSAARAATEGGFADPVFDAQAVFRTLMDAMARPAVARPLRMAARPPAPLSPAAGALVCALADADTPIWLDQVLARSDAVRAWLAFQTGAPQAALASQAAFAIAAGPQTMPPLESFCAGTQDYPDRSTTVILQVDGLAGGAALDFAGPGIDGVARFAPPGMPAGFALQWQANRARFPRGIDLILAGPREIACLPRTARLVTGGE